MHTPNSTAQKGFSLIELMVGLTIGLFVLLGVLLAYSQWDGRSRTASAKTDALTESAVASYLLDTELRTAGLGLGDSPVTGPPCTVAVSPTVSFPLMPISIVNGGPAGEPDTIALLFGTHPAKAVHTAIAFSPTPFSKTLADRGGIVPGDRLILVPESGGACEVIEVTASATVPEPKTIEHKHAISYTSAYTAPTFISNSASNSATGILMGPGWAFSLGGTPRHSTWAITAPPAQPTLTRTDLFGGGLELVAEDVVNLQAVYGIDVSVPDNGPFPTNPASTGIAALWVDTLAKAPFPYPPQAVVAVHYAMLVRSRQYEPPVFDPPSTTPIWITPNAPAPSWAGGAFQMTDVSGPGMGVSDGGPSVQAPSNWRGYRYTVREGVIPVRNTHWGQRP
ncbi:MAG: prepilin-type N-terminal cleavage/methylation domain-containing protein [Rhizobacter sp.]